jgi:anti-anti-sigma regulatory factor
MQVSGHLLRKFPSANCNIGASVGFHISAAGAESFHGPALHHPPAPHLLPSFILAVEDIRGVRIVRLQGPVGMELGRLALEAQETSEAVAGAFSRSLLLDFKATTAWDSSTIAYLVQALRRRTAARAKVAIINAPPKLLAELEISRLRDMFPVYSSENEALANLADPTNISTRGPLSVARSEHRSALRTVAARDDQMQSPL